MYTRIPIVAALLLILAATPGWAATCVAPVEATTCSDTVSPADTTAVFDFTNVGNGYLVVQFDTVLSTFTLTVTLNHTIDPLDPNEFPAGTVCVQYSTTGQCVEYDFSGSSTGPNGVPVKNVDYKGLITLTLSYFTGQIIHTPAFGHAPGDNATAVYSENILTTYSNSTTCGAGGCDPTMGGKTPGLSAVAAFDEPSTGTNTVCGVTLTPTTVGNGEKPQIEVTLAESASSTCGGTGVRDKTAILSVSTQDPTTSAIVFVPLKNAEGNKFHWDYKNGLNEYDVSLDGLTSGQRYTVTVVSSLFSPPQSASFTAP